MSFLERLRSWLAPRPRSLLREIVDREAFLEDPAKALLEAALVVRRAGLEHLVIEASPAEARALAKAGELLEAERAFLVGRAVRAPEDVAEIFDGGDARRRLYLDLALASAVDRRR